MKKQPTPIYDIDKYGLLYQVNPKLSENDKALLAKLKQVRVNKKPKSE